MVPNQRTWPMKAVPFEKTPEDTQARFGESLLDGSHSQRGSQKILDPESKRSARISRPVRVQVIVRGGRKARSVKDNKRDVEVIEVSLCNPLIDITNYSVELLGKRSDQGVEESSANFDRCTHSELASRVQLLVLDEPLQFTNARQRQIW